MRSRHEQRRSKRSTCRLILEGLEVRCVPTTVTNLDDAGPGSLRQAILDTPATGTVDFQDGLCGTITLTSAPLTINKILTIDGPGADCVTVSGNHARQVFHIPAPFTVAISGLTIANGNSGDGAGIFNGGALTIDGCTVSGNSGGGPGGGVENTGNLTVTNSVFSNNSATFFGAGGIYNTGTLFIAGSTFRSNSATDDNGGGIENLGTATVTNSVFSNNFQTRGGYHGGAFFNTGTLTLMGVTLDGNSTAGTAGGIYNTGSLSVGDSTLSGNSAASSGGGIFNNLNGSLNVFRSTFSGNSAASSGGGIGNDSSSSNISITNDTFNLNAAVNGAGIAHTGNGTLTLTDSTLSGNIASNQGGGLFHSGTGRLNTLNTIVAGNRAFTASADVQGPLNSQGYNLIGNGTGGGPYDDTDLVGTADAPIDPLLGPLGDYGGPTFTMATLAGSPALNAGDPDELGNNDQRGVQRTGGVNIGAYQASAIAFDVTAPDATQAGTPFDVTVTAVDAYKQTAVGYVGTATFGTSDMDPGVVLPADYTFTLADGGVHTFTNTGLGETTLITPGDQAVNVTDTADNTITGSATVTVSGAAPGAGRQPRGDGARTGRETAGSDRFFAALREGDFAYFGLLRHGRRGAVPAVDWLGEGDPLAL